MKGKGGSHADGAQRSLCSAGCGPEAGGRENTSLPSSPLTFPLSTGVFHDLKPTSMQEAKELQIVIVVAEGCPAFQDAEQSRSRKIR